MLLLFINDTSDENWKLIPKINSKKINSKDVWTCVYLGTWFRLDSIVSNYVFLSCYFLNLTSSYWMAMQNTNKMRNVWTILQCMNVNMTAPFLYKHQINLLQPQLCLYIFYFVLNQLAIFPHIVLPW